MALIVKVIIGGIVGLFIVVAGLMTMDPKINKSYDSDDPNITSLDEGSIAVTLKGQLIKEGTYTLEPGQTLSDALEKAGGLTSSADKRGVNEDYVLNESITIYVPAVSGYTQSCVIDDTDTKVNINTATANELASIPGISQTLAERIVAYREANGEFKVLEEIQNVLGIGSKTFEKIRDYIILSN
jgi:competence protein ComEA